MFEIELTPGLDEVERWLGPEFKRQATFAIAKSLSQTAVGSKKRIQGTLPADFTVRSQWTGRSIRTTPARKTKLEAIVGSTAEYMALQDEGGIKKGRTGKDVGVPIGARPTPQSKTTLAKHPARMLKKKRVFVASTKAGVLGVWRRKTKKRYPIYLMWILKPQVRIKKRWGFADQVEVFVGVDWPRKLQKALDAALKEPRRR